MCGGVVGWVEASPSVLVASRLSPSWVSPTIPPSCVQLVVLVDVDDPVSSIAELTALAFRCNLTLLLGWSDAECARYVV